MMTELEPIPPYLAGANPVRPEDGPQDVPQERGSVVDLARLLISPPPPSGEQRMLDIARSQLGTDEHSNGWTEYGQWYADRHHDPAFATANWCDMGLSWCAWTAGEGSVVGEYAYTPWHAQWFADQGHWGSRPRPGALVFYSWTGDLTIGGIEHVGLVESQQSDGRIVTIEFNTSTGGSLTGVRRRVRNPSGVVVGYGCPPYPNGPAPVTDEDTAVVVSLGA